MPNINTFDASQKDAKINTTRKEDGKTFITFTDDAGNEQRIIVNTIAFDDMLEPYALRIAEGGADTLIQVFEDFQDKVRKQMSGITPILTEFTAEVRKATNIKRRRTQTVNVPTQ